MSNKTRLGLGVFRSAKPCLYLEKEQADDQINKQLMKVPARILAAPSVMYARNQDARPTDGSWNLRGKEVSSYLRPFFWRIKLMTKFFRNGQAPLKAWSVISFDKYTNVDEMKRYVIYLMQTLERHGVKIDNKQPTLIGPVDPTREQNVKSALQSAARAAFQAGQCAPQLIFIILPGR
jgi:eukaryotic translation initiation factor 2C